MSRASKSGIGADIEQKLKNQYIEQEKLGTPDAIVTWIEGTLADENPKCGGRDFNAIASYLKDGIVLCKFINKLRKAEGKAPISFQKKCASPFIAMTNIENFNKAAADYGLKSEDIFQTTDLWEALIHKGPFINVINSLHRLGVVANSKGFKPKYEGIAAPTLDM